MDLGQWIVIGLSVLMGIWFGVGSFYNRRRGVATFHWLRDGLSSQGKVSEAAWIGSSGSGARLVVGKANTPFRRIELIFLLESREILPLWLFNRIRQKFDEMILKSDLRSTPSQEIEVARSSDRASGALLDEMQSAKREQVEAPEGFVITIRGLTTGDTVERIKSLLTRYGRTIKRVSLQRKTPHLMVHVELPRLREEDAGQFFQALSDTFS